MSSLLFFTFLVLSPWPLFFSYLLYYVATLDSSYNFIVYSKKILYKHWIFLGFIVFLCGTMFVFRLGQMGREIDLFSTFSIVWDLFTFLPYFQGYLLFLSMLIIGIFWFFLFAQFYTYIRRSVIVLYIYYYQFEYFRNLVHIQVHLIIDHKSYLTRRLFKLTKNNRILHYAYGIWPLTPEFVERNLFRFLVPYLYIFDLCVRNGMVSLVFYVLPWMFIYTLIRSFFLLLDKIYLSALFEITAYFYELKYDEN